MFRDLTNGHNMVAAVVHRVARKMPTPNVERAKHFERYAKKFIKHITPCTDSDVPDFKNFIEVMCNWTGGRRKALTKLRRAMTEVDPSWVESKCFIKNEAYDDATKFPRGIMSYTDESKILLACLCHAVDKATYKSGYFVKSTNPKDWPKRMKDMFGENPVLESDFTSFEAHHRGVYARIIHFWFMHMMRGLNIPSYHKRIISRMVLGENKLIFKHLTAMIEERLMSGALWTSSSNGVLNLLILSYITAVAKSNTDDPEAMADWAIENFNGLVEGDDGICDAIEIDQAVLDEMGVILKLGVADNFGLAGFCKITCDPRDLKTVTDPIHALRKFPILDKKFVGRGRAVHAAMMRAKAMSMKCMYPHAPVLGVLADVVLERTSGINLDKVYAEFDTYKREILKSFNQRDWMEEAQPTKGMRILVEKKFGVTCAEQIVMENAFKSGTWEIDLTRFLNMHDFNYVMSHVFGSEVETIPTYLDEHPDVVRNIELFNSRNASDVPKKPKSALDKEWESGGNDHIDLCIESFGVPV